MSLQKRIEALEAQRGGGLTLLLISWLPSGNLGARESATYEGVTYTQGCDESPEQFRARLGECLKGKGQFLWVSELDAAL